MRVRQRKSPGTHVALPARPAFERSRVNRFGKPSRIPPRHRSLRQRRSEQRHDRCRRRSRDVKRPAVAPNVHRGAPDQRAQFGEVEFADIRYGRRLAAPSAARARVGDRLCRRRVGRPRRENDPPRRIAPRQRDDQCLERLARPTAERIAGADMHDHERMRGADAARREADGRPTSAACASSAISSGSRAGSGRVHTERREQIPLVHHRSDAAPRLVGARSTCVYIHERPAMA